MRFMARWWQFAKTFRGAHRGRSMVTGQKIREEDTGREDITDRSRENGERRDEAKDQGVSLNRFIRFNDLLKYLDHGNLTYAQIARHLQTFIFLDKKENTSSRHIII